MYIHVVLRYVYPYMYAYIYMYRSCVYNCWKCSTVHLFFTCVQMRYRYGVALVSRIDKITGLLCKRAL